ncbi:hypothetical protein FA13DRAFT_1724509 [Coprinellus micaceus]|uniref:CENP-V/GFA domain-containing protein n=1 Tax=Coprinellus micaceus TaxID=71717 RepID=A0A4Y7TWN0_COPMI|nr:hypothetical protein FA13DRAFT_1724509 [Coprinellus micaceus]
MSQDIITTGGCYCKAVRYQVKGRPVRAAYCHCTFANAFLEALQTYNVASKPWKKRFRCKDCGCNVANRNANTGKWSVDENAKIENWNVVKPTAHWFYETRILDINDDLTKWAGYEGESERLG